MHAALPSSVDAGRKEIPENKAYYLAQVCGWGVYGVFFFLLGRSPRGLGMALQAVAWCGAGLLGTHVLRTYARRRRWNTIPQLIPAFAVATLIIPAAMLAGPVLASKLLLPQSSASTPHWLIFAHYFQALLVVSVWCAIFLSNNEVRRRRLAETEALRLALVAQISQFRALRSQLNPHFLFNCLNNLRELIDEDRERAKRVVSLLSELLRYTLRVDRVETVSLQEELRAVSDYLSLEKIRYEERMRVHLNIDPASLEVRLPPMLLQSLTENAVKHGIARLPAGGQLGIATRVSQGSLQVEVTNTGALSLPEEGSTSVGLDNARERLRLMYGNQASLTLAARDPGTVSAIVLIPLSSNGADS